MKWILSKLGSWTKKNFFRKSSDMVCKEVALSTTMKRKLRLSLNKFEHLLKDKRETFNAKMFTIKEIKNKVMSLGFNPTYTFHSKEILEYKDNEIEHMRK